MPHFRGAHETSVPMTASREESVWYENFRISQIYQRSGKIEPGIDVTAFDDPYFSIKLVYTDEAIPSLSFVA